MHSLLDGRITRNATWLFLLSILLILVLLGRGSYKPGSVDAPKKTTLSDHKKQESSNEILLLYVHSNTHSYAYGNLKYFIENTIQPNDRVDYYFILQRPDNKSIDLNTMPPLPSSNNAHYIQHENLCFDFGTYGWFFDQYTIGNPWKKVETNDRSRNKKLILKNYKYFIFINSSVRGPFFPPYYLKILSEATNYQLFWYSAFTNRLKNQVKLVGCTISCETVPHVQTYFFATDWTGLKILLKPGIEGGTSQEGIFACYPTKDHVSIYSELPTSSRIISAGYRIDSLLTEYQNWNFTDGPHRFCNENLNPYKDKMYHGRSLEPYEVVFVKFNDLEFLRDARERARVYQNWTETNKI